VYIYNFWKRKANPATLTKEAKIIQKARRMIGMNISVRVSLESAFTPVMKEKIGAPQNRGGQILYIAVERGAVR
jgi:hypothetical protein